MLGRQGCCASPRVADAPTRSHKRPRWSGRGAANHYTSPFNSVRAQQGSGACGYARLVRTCDLPQRQQRLCHARAVSRHGSSQNGRPATRASFTTGSSSSDPAHTATGARDGRARTRTRTRQPDPRRRPIDVVREPSAAPSPRRSPNARSAATRSSACRGIASGPTRSRLRSRGRRNSGQGAGDGRGRRASSGSARGRHPYAEA